MDYSTFAERERAGWADSDITDGYVRGFGPVVDRACDAHLGLMPETGRVLDLCCGQGTLTAKLAQAGREISGLDFSADMLERARKAAPDADLRHGDAQDLPYPDDLFDAVVCNFGMMHIPDQPKALAEVSRVLKPGGVFSMTSWVGPEASDAFRLIFANARANLPEGISPPPQPDLFIYGRPDDAARFLEQSGLVAEQHDILPLAWDLDDPDELFMIFLTGTVGARMTLMALGDEGRARAAAGVAEEIERDYRNGERFRIPAPVAHIVARAV